MLLSINNEKILHLSTLVYDQVSNVGQTEHESVLAAGQFAHESVSVHCEANTK